MNGDIIVDIAQVISSFAMVISVIYLGIQIRHNHKIMKLEFGFKLNERLYKRYFQSSHNENFAKLLSRNWREEEFEDHDYWRMTLWIQTCLVDIFEISPRVSLEIHPTGSYARTPITGSLTPHRNSPATRAEEKLLLR